METETEPGYLGMSKSWFFRALITGMVLGAAFAGVAQQWWIMPITILLAVVVGSGWSALRRHRDAANAAQGD